MKDHDTRSGPKWATPAILGLILLLGMPLAASAAGAAVQVQHSDSVGDYLTDGSGKTLYLFEKDEAGKSTCNEACAKAWPPFVSAGTVTAGESVDADKLGTTKRKDGASQVTYGDWPLYYFVKDKEAGDIHGQEVNGFGGEWYVVSPAGHKAEAGEDEDEEHTEELESGGYSG